MSEESKITADAIAAHAEKFAEPEPPVVTPSDYERLYAESREENARLNAVLAAARISTRPSSEHPQKDLKPAITAARFKASISPVDFLKLSRDQKLLGIGLDPAGVDDGYVRRVFGRGADSALGVELMKTSPLRYRQLKEAAEVLGLYGA